jgi:chromosome segregation protein
MYLRSLSLKGFKSFAQKAVLRFEPGITVIIGPNGSGKSNICDAALWVLGEQSAKSLRGGSMEDVIFAGTNDQPPLGKAEVSLVLDNTDRLLPIDYSEITISRCMFRSGESRYSINGSVCRLIDIQELLFDSGLGRQAYSIISQGKLDYILSCRPEERRQLIEEAAGVLKYKKRKQRALSRLTSMEGNLVRLKDIIGEVRHQLKPIKHQANLVEKFQQLKAALRETQVSIAVKELENYQRQWKKWEEQETKAAKQLEDLKSSSRNLEKAIVKIETNLKDNSRESALLSQKKSWLQKIETQINSGLLVLKERGRSLAEQLARLKQEIVQTNQAVDKARQSLSETATSKEKINKTLGDYHDHLLNLQKEVDELKKKNQLISDRRRQLKAELEGKNKEIYGTKQELTKAEATLNVAKEQIDFLKLEREKLDRKKRILIETKEKEVKQQNQLLAEDKKLSLSISNKLSELDEFELLLGKQKDEIDNLQTSIKEVLARLSALKEIEDNLLEEIGFEDWEEKDNFAEQVYGYLFKLIEVPRPYQKAIEAALGEKSKALIIDKMSKAKEMFFNSRGKLSYLIVMPTDVKQFKVKRPRIPNAVVASDVVSCKKVFKPLISSLLSQVLIVESLELFLTRSKLTLPANWLVVSMDGELISAQGYLKRHQSGSVFNSISYQSEITELRTKKEYLADRLLLANQEYKANSERIRKKKAQLSDLEQQGRQISKKISAGRAKIEELNRQIKAASQQQMQLESLLNKRINDMEVAQQAVETKTQTANQETQMEEIESQLQILEQQHHRQLATERAKLNELTKFKVEAASLSEKQIYLDKRCLSLKTEIAEKEKKLANQRQALDCLEALIEKMQPLSQLYSNLLKTSQRWDDYLTNLSSQQGDISQKLYRDLQVKKADLQAKVDLENQIKELLAKINVDKAKSEVEVSRAVKFLSDDLGMPLEKAQAMTAGDVSLSYLFREESRLKAELAKLGPVNPLAIEQFEELESREKFLSSQLDDLLKSKRILGKVVRAIDNKIKEKLYFTFEETNNNFQEVISLLFPGGQGCLRLTEADDIFDSGVEIEAQPQGKRHHCLSLLSGGERSLVGLAFLFAIHYTRPSPFYILDEAEAALDDVNIQRFSSLLKRLKQKTQFLIITHQRRTMEMADCLYGVTMQADGVSKVISQKISQKLEEDNKQSERDRLVFKA